MGSASPSSVLLCIFNIVHVVLALAITCLAIWFFVEVHSITSLRNTNHYLLDFDVYWPQAIPWVFVLVGVLAICVSCCGFVGAKKKKNGFVMMFIGFQVTSIIALIAAAIVTLTLADTKTSETFLQDAIWDVFNTMKSERAVETAFGRIERRLQCCGASGPRDYKNSRDTLPMSCCDTNHHGWIGQYNIICEFSNKLANERHGCSQVAVNYASIIMKVLSAAAIFTALIGIINLIIAIALSKRIKRKPHLPVQKEPETKKVLLLTI